MRLSPRPSLGPSLGPSLRLSPRTLLPLVVSLLAGALCTIGFAPFHAFAVPWIALAVWLALIADAPPSVAGRRGYAFGVGYFATGVSWVQVSAHQFGVPSYFFSVPVTGLLVLYLALFPMLAAWTAAKLTAVGGRRLVALVLLVPLSEALCGLLLTGFPWQALGYSQLDGPLAGFLPLIGVAGTSALTMAVGAGLAFSGRQMVVRRLRIAATVALVVLLAAGVALKTVPFTTPVGEPLAVALVQGNVPQAKKWLPSEREPTIENYLLLSREAMARGAKVVIWPETAIPAFAEDMTPLLDGIEALGQREDVSFLIGVPRRVRDGEAVDLYNSLIALGAKVGPRAADRRYPTYDKRHLVPFGEYLPFANLLEAPLKDLGVRLANFRRGALDQPLLSTRGVPLGASVCFEDVFAREVRIGLTDTRWLVNVSNDAWFGDSLAPHQHMAIARARAMETGRPLVRATNTGVSAFVNAKGEVTARSPQFERHVLQGTVQPHAGLTPFARLGERGVYLGMLVLLGLWVGLGGRRRVLA